jgi:hypothetical protein
MAEHMKALAEEIRKNVRDLMKSKPDGKDEGEMKKWSEEFSKNIEKNFGADFQKRMREFEKKMEKDFGPEFQKRYDSNVYTIPRFDPKAPSTPSVSITPRLAPRSRLLALNSPGGVHLTDPTSLLNSLTPAQQEKMKKQGYLTLEDLNADQKKLIGNPTGTFEISVSVDGKSLTIKNRAK